MLIVDQLCVHLFSSIMVHNNYVMQKEMGIKRVKDVPRDPT